MEIIDELRELEESSRYLKKDFNNQMNAMEDDMQDFHKQIIKLSTKYPEQKEILEFIVFINDRIETNQTNYKGVINDTLNNIIDIKHQIIKQHLKARMIDKDYESNRTIWGKIYSFINTLKDIKWVLTISFFTLVFIGYYINPELSAIIFEKIIKIFSIVI